MSATIRQSGDARRGPSEKTDLAVIRRVRLDGRAAARDGADDPRQQAGTDEGDDDGEEHARRAVEEEAEDEAPDQRADDPDDEIGGETAAAGAHHLMGEEARD